MKGRSSTPDALNKLHGDPGKRRRKRTESKPEPAASPEPAESKPADAAKIFFSEGADAPPAWLNEDAKAIWRAELPDIKTRVMLLAPHMQVFALYCEALQRYRKHGKFLAEKDETYQTPSGFWRKRPEVELRDRAFNDVTKLAVELNLTPKSWINSTATREARQLDLFTAGERRSPTQQPPAGDTPKPANSLNDYTAARPTLQ
jgi:P27 family predicted phage terminase small subunit